MGSRKPSKYSRKSGHSRKSRKEKHPRKGRSAYQTFIANHFQAKKSEIMRRRNLLPSKATQKQVFAVNHQVIKELAAQWRESSHYKGKASRKSGKASRKSGKASRKSGKGSRKSGKASRKSGRGSRKSGKASRKSGKASRKSGRGSRKSGKASRKSRKPAHKTTRKSTPWGAHVKKEFKTVYHRFSHGKKDISKAEHKLYFKETMKELSRTFGGRKPAKPSKKSKKEHSRKSAKSTKSTKSRKSRKERKPKHKKVDTELMMNGADYAQKKMYSTAYKADAKKMSLSQLLKYY